MTGLMPTLLLLLSVSSGPDVSAREEANAWETGARHVELTADSSGEPVEVRVSPGVGTLLLFDVAPARVEVEARQRFRVAGLEGALLVLLPATSFLAAGEGKVTAHFADGAAPAVVTFQLRAVPPALAERQLELHRLPRQLESYAQEVRDLREQNGSLRREVARLRAAQAHPDGLLSLLADEDQPLEEGVAARHVEPTRVGRPGSAPSPARGWALRSTRRVALAVNLWNHGTLPWNAEGAALRGRAGASLKVLRVWQAAPILPGRGGRVLVEAENTPQVANGPFTLTLWEAGTRNPVTLGNITFP